MKKWQRPDFIKENYIEVSATVKKVMRSETRKGPLYEYINFASCPRKSSRSDWPYPVDFWTGQDGLNKDAYDFWFGKYEITKLT